MNTVLIVEDDIIIAYDVKNTLEKYGYKIFDIVLSAEDAIASVEKNKPDLVIMDIILAGEMSGLEAAKVIAEKYSGNIVFLSALADVKTLQLAGDISSLGYIIKPFQDNVLISKIDNAFEKIANKKK
jgi:CheY-like chemotaxis protein